MNPLMKLIVLFVLSKPFISRELFMIGLLGRKNIRVDFKLA